MYILLLLPEYLCDPFPIPAYPVRAGSSKSCLSYLKKKTLSEGHYRWLTTTNQKALTQAQTLREVTNAAQGQIIIM